MRLVRSLAAIVALAPAVMLTPATGTAWAQDKHFELKLAHWVPPTHPLQKAMEDWGSSIEKASNGTITYKVYPSEQLGKAFDHYDMARDGIADVTYINPGYQPGRFPIIDAGNLPFMMSEGKEGSEALDAWYRKYAAKEMKEVKFCLAFVHDYGSWHSKTKKIVVPADVKGLKVRPAQAMIATLVTQLGGINIQSAAPQIRDVIEKGVADAGTFPWGSTYLFHLNDVTKYHMNVPLYTTVFAWVMNKHTYESMSPFQQKVIDDHCNSEWAARVAGPWAAFERAGVAKLKADPAHEVYTLTPEQLALWKKAAEGVEKVWAANVRKVGIDPDVALAELRASVAKYHALQ
jgi:TRAP-type C4-dicarboxylate transport system substrate-binding protein